MSQRTARRYTSKCLDFLTNPLIDRYFYSTEILNLTGKGIHRFLVNEKFVYLNRAVNSRT
jgi:hypothetical protein